MNNHRVVEYGIPAGKMVGSFGLDRLAEVIREIIKHKNIVLQCAEIGGTVRFDDFIPYHIASSVILHDNALVFYFEEFKNESAKQEDAGKSVLYIFEDEIVYVVTEVDPITNKEYKINTHLLGDLAAKAGKVSVVPPAEVEATSFSEKVSRFFTKRKRAKVQQERTRQLNRIYAAVNKLDSVTDIERK